MSSFLPLAQFGWGSVAGSIEVDVVTLDDFASKHAISHVDVLKSDTQGFDMEVLKGASRLLAERRVSAILLEMIFTDMYTGAAKPDQILRELGGHGFLLVNFYDPGFQSGILSWCDALFVHSSRLYPARRN